MFSYLKNLKWKQIFANFRITRILGRTYYFSNFLLIAILDLIYLACTNFTIALNFWTILLGILTLITIIRLSFNIYYIIRSKHYKNSLTENCERSSVRSGVMRCGKTSNMNYDAVELAKIQWKRLKQAYWYCVNVKYQDLPEHLKKHKNEIIEAYHYSLTNIEHFIPCLFSFQTIFVGTRQSNPLNRNMLLQKEKLPYMSVIALDEISTLFGNKDSRTVDKQDKLLVEQNLKKLSDLFRFIGHYLDGYIIMTEQEFGKAFIDIRRVTAQNIYFTEKQKWVLKPWLLTAIYNFFFCFFDWYSSEMSLFKQDSKHFTKAYKKLCFTSRKFSKFMKFLKNIISCTGYRKYVYQLQKNDVTNIQITVEKKPKTSKFYLPSCLNCQYNDRAFREKYEAKNLDFTTPQQETFYLSKSDIENKYK